MPAEIIKIEVKVSCKECGVYVILNGVHKIGNYQDQYSAIMYTLLDKSHLRMSGTNGAAIFERYKDPGSNDNGNITYGCYDADANFAANPIAPY